MFINSFASYAFSKKISFLTFEISLCHFLTHFVLIFAAGYPIIVLTNLRLSREYGENHPTSNHGARNNQGMFYKLGCIVFV